jgi:hypothetical protein
MKKTLATEMVVAAALLAIGVVSSVEFTAIQVSATSMMSGNQTGGGNVTGKNMTSQSAIASAINDLQIAIKDLKAGNMKGAMTEMNVSQFLVEKNLNPAGFR